MSSGYTKYLFVCVENAGRSQMAEAFAKSNGISAESAGTLPSEKPNPVVVAAMKEKGIDISHAKPKMLTVEMVNRADVIITMGCSVLDVCPRPMLARMQVKLIDWKLPDPKGKPLEEVTKIRDQIEIYVKELANDAMLDKDGVLTSG